MARVTYAPDSIVWTFHNGDRVVSDTTDVEWCDHAQAYMPRAEHRRQAMLRKRRRTGKITITLVRHEEVRRTTVSGVVKI